MTMIVPPKYPPELPIIIANRICENPDFSIPKRAIILGYLFPREHTGSFIDKAASLKLGADNVEIGYYLSSDSQDNSLVYSCPMDDFEDILEGTSLALHVFKLLGFDQFTLIDGVNVVLSDSPPIVAIIDHINQTGINPLDYWMMLSPPEPFFLDVKNLYLKPQSDNIPTSVHLATPTDGIPNIESVLKDSKASSWGGSICPLSILGGYLGMKVRAFGVNVNQDIEMNTLQDRLLY